MIPTSPGLALSHSEQSRSDIFCDVDASFFFCFFFHFKGNFLGGLFRHFVRRGLPPSPAGSRQTSPSSAAKRTPTKALAFTEAPEQKFFKLADTFVKQVLR